MRYWDTWADSRSMKLSGWLPDFAWQFRLKVKKMLLVLSSLLGSDGGTATPAGPEAITDYTLEPGVSDGTLTLTINTNPDAGDSTTAGDGLGTITGYQWQPVDYPVWFSIGDGTPDAFTLASPILSGETNMYNIRALGFGGRAGTITTTASVVAPGVAVNIRYLYTTDEKQLYTSDEKKLIVLTPA